MLSEGGPKENNDVDTRDREDDKTAEKEDREGVEWLGKWGTEGNWVCVQEKKEFAFIS